VSTTGLEFFDSNAKQRPLLSAYNRWRARAKILKLSKAARLRLEWIIYDYQKENAALTTRHFGISRKALYTWKNRFDELDLTSLEDRSKRPHSLRAKQYTVREVSRVRQLRELYPTLGRDKLAILYQDHYGTTIKIWSLRRIIHDYQLEAQRAVRTRRRNGNAKPGGLRKKRVTELAKQPFPGFLLEVDTIVLYYAGGKRYIVTAVDHHSRIAFARMYTTKASRNAADFLRRLVVLLDGQLCNIHIDNGSEFQKDFQAAAEDLGINLYHARPYTPKDKPLVERFNGILQQEFVNLGHFTTDVDEFNQSLTEWLIFYNFVRPHHSLGLKRPAEFANMKAARVLPMYSPMTKS
jgi:transposase InsO family protein